MRRLPIGITAAASLLGAMPATGQQPEQFVGAHGATVPASYLGSDADGDLQLDLWPDQGFHLLRSPHGNGTPKAFAGRWHADGRRLFLDLGGALMVLEVRNSGRLRPEGAPDDASADLVGEGTLEPASITLPLDGMFTYYADAPSILHCATGRTYSVMQEGAYVDLERAYLEDRPGPAEPLYVTIDATIAERPQMEGPDRPSVIVDGFGATWPGENCERAVGVHGLTSTVWRIRTIGGEALAWSPPAREPFLVFDEEELRFNASVGCNTILGSFSASEYDLAFGPAASTMMACPDDLADHEAALVAALEATTGHMIGGRSLHLLDDGGSLTAELEAVYLP